MKDEASSGVFTAHSNVADGEGRKMVALNPTRQLEGRYLFVSPGFALTDGKLACFAAPSNHTDSQGQHLFVSAPNSVEGEEPVFQKLL